MITDAGEASHLAETAKVAGTTLISFDGRMRRLSP